MKVLLCLLSDQHVPNLLSVHHYVPDQLVLIESRQMESRKVASHFLKALKLGNLDYDARHHIEPLNAEDNSFRCETCVATRLRQVFEW